jgi:transposase
MGKSSTPRKFQTSPKGVFAGLDYHKKFTVVSVGDKFGREILSQKIPNDREAFREFFSRFPGIKCAIESCRGYEWLLDFLKEELNLEVKLVNVHRLKLITESKRKTDKIDAKTIMRMLAIGFLPECYQPTVEERRLRERLRWRAHLVRYSTRMKVRIHALLDKENVGLSIKDPFSRDGRKLLKQVELTNGRQELLTEHIGLLDGFEKLVKNEDSWVSQEVRKNPQAQLLTTIPGIGELTALLLWAEMGDVTRFRDAAHVASYFGIVPSVKSSADRKCYGPITKQGSKFVRWMLVQCAWHAIRKSLPLREHFHSVRLRAGNNGAIVSVARKLVKIAYRVLRDKKPFQAKLVGKQETA